MLKIKVIDGEIYAESQDWEKLSFDERFFLRDCYNNDMPFIKSDVKGNLRLELPEKAHWIGSERYPWGWKHFCLKTVKELCELYHIPFNNAFLELFQKVAEEAKAEEWQRRKTNLKTDYLESLEKNIATANTRMHEGCGTCFFLRMAAYKPYCIAATRFPRYKTDEVEAEFYARRESKITGLELEFYAAPYPCAGCPVVENGRRALEKRSEFLDKHLKME